MRTHRRKVGFTQRELAHLVGCASSAQISRYERLKRVPTLHVLVAYTIIFERCGYDLYPEIFHDVEAQIKDRARDLYDELQGTATLRNNAKLDALETLLDRIDKPRNKTGV